MSTPPTTSAVDALRVPRWQLELWRSLAGDAKEAASTEMAPTTHGILVALCEHLGDFVKVIEQDRVVDEKWEADYAATHRGEAGQWVRGNWSLDHLRPESKR